MLEKEPENVHYNSLIAADDDTKAKIILHVDNSRVSRMVLLRKNEEIAQLRQQLIDNAARIWQSEQLLNKIIKHINRLSESPELRVSLEGTRNLLEEFKGYNARNSVENNLLLDQNFVRELQSKYPTLSSNDLRICSLLRLNLSTKEVAQKLGISAESANKARYRIRKKLKLSHQRDLVQFLIEF